MPDWVCGWKRIVTQFHMCGTRRVMRTCGEMDMGKECMWLEDPEFKGSGHDVWLRSQKEMGYSIKGEWLYICRKDHRADLEWSVASQLSDTPSGNCFGRVGTPTVLSLSSIISLALSKEDKLVRRLSLLLPQNWKWNGYSVEVILVYPRLYVSSIWYLHTTLVERYNR